MSNWLVIIIVILMVVVFVVPPILNECLDNMPMWLDITIAILMVVVVFVVPPILNDYLAKEEERKKHEKQNSDTEKQNA